MLGVRGVVNLRFSILLKSAHMMDSGPRGRVRALRPREPRVSERVCYPVLLCHCSARLLANSYTKRNARATSCRVHVIRDPARDIPWPPGAHARHAATRSPFWQPEEPEEAPMASARCQGASMSSPRALLVTECDRQRPQQELLRELELTQLSEESLQTTIECASCERSSPC